MAKADVPLADPNVCYWHLADILRAKLNVGF
jgi:hypothetical protein